MVENSVLFLRAFGFKTLGSCELTPGMPLIDTIPLWKTLTDKLGQTIPSGIDHWWTLLQLQLIQYYHVSNNVHLHFQSGFYD